MTIASTTSKVSYNGSGTVGPFPVTFKFTKDADITATKRASTGAETVLTLTTDYTLTGAGDASGGALTLVAALAVGESLVIARVPGILQEVDYVENSAFPAETHEGALDLLTMICQSLQEQVDRAVKVEISSTTDPDDLLAELAADVVSAAASAATATTQAGLATTNGAAQVALAAAQVALAEDAKDAAVVAQGLAEDASSLAQEWAENPEDDAVTGHPGEYSAYHWSKKAEAAASGGAVKVSANDTTPGYLEAKVVASTGIVLTTQNEGANETRSIAADVGASAGKLVQLDANGKLPAGPGDLLTGRSPLAKLALLTNRIIYIDSTGAPQQVALGAAGTALLSQGPAAVPIFGAAGGDWWEYVMSSTAAASAFLAFTGLDTTVYDYRVEFEDICCANYAASVNLQQGTGATPTYSSTNFGGVSCNFTSSTASGSAISGVYAVAAGVAAAPMRVRGYIELQKKVGEQPVYSSWAGSRRGVTVDAVTLTHVTNSDTTAVTALKFMPVNDVITSGTMHLYRRKKL
jgi:hypothetical protein